MATVFDLLKDIATDDSIRRSLENTDSLDQLLGQYELTEEQKDLIRSSVDESVSYEERAQAVGRSVDIGYSELLSQGRRRGRVIVPC